MGETNGKVLLNRLPRFLIEACETLVQSSGCGPGSFRPVVTGGSDPMIAPFSII